jgi:hypothetical protein
MKKRLKNAQDLHTSKKIYNEIEALMRTHLAIHPNDMEGYQAKINGLSTSWNIQKQKAQSAQEASGMVGGQLRF